MCFPIGAGELTLNRAVTAEIGDDWQLFLWSVTMPDYSSHDSSDGRGINENRIDSAKKFQSFP